MELFKAANQWSTRPADERFWNLTEAKNAARAYESTAVEFSRPFGEVRAEVVDGEVRLVGRAGVPAKFTHYAFGQFSTIAGAPPSYLRTLPATLAVQNLNHGLRNNVPQDKTAAMMAHQNGDMLLRCVTSEKYERIWNGRIIDTVDRYFTPLGFKAPPARPAGLENERTSIATEADVIAGMQGGVQIKAGDQIAPAGIYVSDHDMFLFLVRQEVTIDVPGSSLMRGIMVWNSEVGTKSLGMLHFLADGVCGNHIVWGAKDVSEIRIKHVGEAHARLARAEVKIRCYADDSISDTRAKILTAQNYELGGTKEEVLETLFALCAKRRVQLGKGLLEGAYDVAERTPRYGNPRALWGIVNGLTELSQQSSYADERVRIDRAAGKLLEVVF